jgi:uncharacterized protein (DUF697 family)
VETTWSFSTLSELKARPPGSHQEEDMHDIDRNILETSFEGEVFEYEGPNYETWSGEYQEYEAEAFGEAEAMELAAELLEVSNEQDLEQFLGGLLKKVGIKLPDMQAVGGVLKGLAKKALPLAATAAGSFFGGPIGAKIGNAVGKFAASKIPDELESLSQEDREFEGAKQFVQIAGQVARPIQVKRGSNYPLTVDLH